VHEAHRASCVADAVAIALGARPTPRTRKALNEALVLVADHELNASSFAARVAASTGADLYACIGSALGALSGPLHGGACDRVEALVGEIGKPDRAAAVILERTRRGDAVPGFGHPLYPQGDPRGAWLLSRSAHRATPSKILAALVVAMNRAGRERATLDVALVARAADLRLGRGAAAAIFAIGRSAGWIAHVFEQRRAGYIVRPRAKYTGRAIPLG
jgi:citrate synthase